MNTSDAPESAPRVAARRRVLDLINASWITQAIAVAAELRIADLLTDGPRDISTLALHTNTHAPSLRRLLCALATLDLVRQLEPTTFALTETGALLRTDTDESLAAWAQFCGGRAWACWGQLIDSVRTGDSARRRATGRDDFTHLESEGSAAAVFHRAMTDLTRPIARSVADRIDFTEPCTIVDVGGGYGELLASVLVSYPSARGMLVDLPHAIALARPYLAAHRVAERCDLVAQSFFDGLPPGGDAYLLKSVLHDWDDTRAVQILGQCGRAMRGHAGPGKCRLFVIERIAPERFEANVRDQTIARSDLNMLVSRGGRERTQVQYVALLHAAGFRVAGITALAGEYSAIEACTGA